MQDGGGIKVQKVKIILVQYSNHSTAKAGTLEKCGKLCFPLALWARRVMLYIKVPLVWV